MAKIKACIILLIAIGLGYIIHENLLSVKLNKLIKGKEAEIGIAIIKDKKSWTVGSDELLPMMSTFKYFVALKVLDKQEREKSPLNKIIVVNKNMIDKGLYSPMLKKYKTYPFKISVADLLKYMISVSDNNACDILIEYAGGIKRIQDYVHATGFIDVELLVNETEMNQDSEKQYLNKAYPIDVTRAMKFTRDENILSETSRRFLDEIMINSIIGEEKLKSGLPKDTVIGHKTGSSSRKINGVKISDNDAGYVFLPNGKVYYIAVVIKNSKMSDEENAKLMSDISKVTYKHFTKCFNNLFRLTHI